MMKLNKTNTIKVLSQYAEAWEYEIDLAPLMECGYFEERILLNKELDKYDKYEIFLACLMHIHQDALQQDEFEISELVMRAFYQQNQVIKFDVVQCEDEDTSNWLYFANQYFNNVIHSQLANYDKK